MDLSITLGVLSGVAVIAAIVGALTERKLMWQASLIVTVLAVCGWGLYPPGDSLKLGPDLDGGTSLLYEVDVEEQANPQEAIRETIEVLKERVDPEGLKNLVWQIEGKNRISVLMPRPSREVKALRETLDNAEAAINQRNVPAHQLRAVLDQDESDYAKTRAQMDKAEPGRGKLLDAARAAKAAVKAADAAVKQAGADAAFKIELLAAKAEADVAYEAALEALQNSSVSVADLLRVMAKPAKVVAGGEQKSPRELAMEQTLAAHPLRTEEIQTFFDAYGAYQQKKGTLDDPEDLKRLLRGAGVLEFRILVQLAFVMDTGSRATPDDVAADQIALMIDQLKRDGPDSFAGRDMVWVGIRDLSRFFNPKAARDVIVALSQTSQAAQRDAIVSQFFAGRGCVGAQYGDNFYVLAWNTPAKSMTQRPEQEGWGVNDVGRTVDDNYFPAVRMAMNQTGGRFMSEITGPNIERAMGMILDGKLISAPSINSRLSTNIQISGGSGGFSEAEQDYLVRTLSAGSLKAKVSPEPIAERTMSPTLGHDNLEKGLTAARDALVIVAIFMIVYYFFSGAVAAMALVANILIILGVMSMYKASFTLPGIAGIVLTIGMCVDANVLIFERIREELIRGAETDAAVRLGYQRAFSSIIDANITNLIVCVILYQTATVEVRGFAITLGVGICATLFTSLFMTRVIFELWRRGMGGAALGGQLPMSVPAVDKLLTPNIRWIAKRPIFFTLSTIAVVGGVFLAANQGRDLLDIEFRAGTEVAFELGKGQTMTLEEARDVRAKISDLYLASPDSLQGDDKKMAQRLKQMVADRRAGLKAELIASAKEDAQLKAERDGGELQAVDEASIAKHVDEMTDLGAIGSATIVGIGDQVADNSYTQYSLVTVIEDQQVVSDAVKIAYANVLDIRHRVSFDHDEVEGYTDQTPAYPLPDTTARPELDQAVSDYLNEFRGGIVVHITGIEPAISISDFEQRLKRMRYQPDFEKLGNRERVVLGVRPVPGSLDRFTSFAVLVSDPSISYQAATDAGNRSQWEAMAGQEWRMVRTALQSETSLSKVSNFTPSVAQTLRDQAVVAVVLSLMAIVAYIWFRFGSLRYGLAAIVALVHDVTIALGAVAASHYLFQSPIGEALLLGEFKLNLALIAAWLTIIGYSLNDTIVMFDRIRENRGKLDHATSQIIDASINQTFSRTMLTSLTTLLAVVMLYIFGGEGIRPFAFTLTVGVIVGTYSSVAIAAPLVAFGGLPTPPKAADEGEKVGEADAAAV